MALSRRLNDNTYTAALPDALTSGPRRRAPAPSRYERGEDFPIGHPNGSHMPIDTGIHWHWNNPLNLIVAVVLLTFLIAAVGVIIG